MFIFDVGRGWFTSRGVIVTECSSDLLWYWIYIFCGHMGQLTLEMDGVLVHWWLQWGESISTIPQVGHCVPTFCKSPGELMQEIAWMPFCWVHPSVPVRRVASGNMPFPSWRKRPNLKAMISCDSLVDFLGSLFGIIGNPRSTRFLSPWRLHIFIKENPYGVTRKMIYIHSEFSASTCKRLQRLWVICGCSGRFRGHGLAQTCRFDMIWPVVSWGTCS